MDEPSHVQFIIGQLRQGDHVFRNPDGLVLDQFHLDIDARRETR